MHNLDEFDIQRALKTWEKRTLHAEYHVSFISRINVKKSSSRTRIWISCRLNYQTLQLSYRYRSYDKFSRINLFYSHLLRVETRRMNDNTSSPTFDRLLSSQDAQALIVRTRVVLWSGVIQHYKFIDYLCYTYSYIITCTSNDFILLCARNNRFVGISYILRDK